MASIIMVHNPAVPLNQSITTPINPEARSSRNLFICIGSTITKALKMIGVIWGSIAILSKSSSCINDSVISNIEYGAIYCIFVYSLYLFVTRTEALMSALGSRC